MDGNRFDDLTRTLAGPVGGAATRRALLRGAVAGLLAALSVGTAAEAQVTQAQCGNKTCKNNPGRCGDACVCCVYSNGNSRCLPPGQCGPGAVACPPERPVLDASGRCVASPGGCSGSGGCEDGNPCTTNVCNRGECVTGFVGDGQQGGCAAGQVCENGGCATPCVPNCTDKCGGASDGCAGTCDATCPCAPNLGAPCDDAGQCCPDGVAVACSPVVSLSQDQCCRPIGAACATPGDFRECCGYVFVPGVNGTLASVTCAPGGTCGGSGAICYGGGGFVCASGVCCGFGGDSRCCAVGEQCLAGQCVLGS